jgi:hypothetical protein
MTAAHVPDKNCLEINEKHFYQSKKLNFIDSERGKQGRL